MPHALPEVEFLNVTYRGEEDDHGGHGGGEPGHGCVGRGRASGALTLLHLLPASTARTACTQCTLLPVGRLRCREGHRLISTSAHQFITSLVIGFVLRLSRKQIRPGMRSMRERTPSDSAFHSRIVFKVTFPGIEGKGN